METITVTEIIEKTVYLAATCASLTGTPTATGQGRAEDGAGWEPSGFCASSGKWAALSRTFSLVSTVATFFCAEVIADDYPVWEKRLALALCVATNAIEIFATSGTAICALQGHGVWWNVVFTIVSAVLKLAAAYRAYKKKLREDRDLWGGLREIFGRD